MTKYIYPRRQAHTVRERERERREGGREGDKTMQRRFFFTTPFSVSCQPFSLGFFSIFTPSLYFLVVAARSVSYFVWVLVYLAWPCSVVSPCDGSGAGFLSRSRRSNKQTIRREESVHKAHRRGDEEGEKEGEKDTQEGKRKAKGSEKESQDRHTNKQREVVHLSLSRLYKHIVKAVAALF